MNEVDLSPAEQEGIGSMEGDEKIFHSEGPTTVNLTAPLRCWRSGARWPRPPPHRCKYRHALYKPRDPHRTDARPCTRTPSGARARHRVHAQAIGCTHRPSCARTYHRARAHVIACTDTATACTRTSSRARTWGSCVYAHVIWHARARHSVRGWTPAKRPVSQRLVYRHTDAYGNTQTHTPSHTGPRTVSW